MLCEVKVPKFAEGAVAITLKQWLCKKGDRLEEGAAIAEAATDKIAINIEVPSAGYVVRAQSGRGPASESRAGDRRAVIGTLRGKVTTKRDSLLDHP